MFRWWYSFFYNEHGQIIPAAPDETVLRDRSLKFSAKKAPSADTPDPDLHKSDLGSSVSALLSDLQRGLLKATDAVGTTTRSGGVRGGALRAARLALP